MGGISLGMANKIVISFMFTIIFDQNHTKLTLRFDQKPLRLTLNYNQKIRNKFNETDY